VGARGERCATIRGSVAHLVLFIAATAGLALSSSANAADLTIELATERAALAADYLLRVERPDGSFVYEDNLAAGRATSEDHIVRQVGAGFGIGLYANWTKRPEFLKRLSRAIDYYVNASIPFNGGRLVAGGIDPVDAHAGATALALLSELLHFATTGQDAYAEPRRDWLAGLRALWIDGVGFASWPTSTQSSSYYDGESWLALAFYNQIFPDDETVRDLLATVDEALMNRYGGQLEVGFMQWGMLASAVRYQVTGDDRFVTFAAGLAQMTLDAVPFSTENNACSMVEGFAATATLLEERPDRRRLLNQIASRIRADLSNALELQILPGETQIDLGAGRFFYDEDLGRLAGAFRNARYDLNSRIDATEHCLAALIGYAQWQRSRNQ
jgi:hypothetical protein